jgi:hypothetical protein
VSEQPDFSTSPRARRLPWRDLAAVTLGILALAFAVWTAWSTRKEADAARDKLVAVRREIGILERRVRVLSERDTTGGKLLARAALAQEAPPERIVAALARLLPDDVRVERLSVSYGDAVSLEMRLVARNAEAWDAALQRLSEPGPLEKVIPGPERREGEIRTSVSARWRGTGP